MGKGCAGGFLVFRQLIVFCKTVVGNNPYKEEGLSYLYDF